MKNYIVLEYLRADWAEIIEEFKKLNNNVEILSNKNNDYYYDDSYFIAYDRLNKSLNRLPKFIIESIKDQVIMCKNPKEFINLVLEISSKSDVYEITIKSELKSGMIVELRNGDRLLVVNNIIIGEDGFDLLDDNYLEDFKNKTVHELDIIKVFKEHKRYGHGFINGLLNSEDDDIIWKGNNEK